MTTFLFVNMPDMKWYLRIKMLSMLVRRD